MDLQAAIDEVARWCAQQTAAGNQEVIEMDSHAMVCITLGEWSPPWHVRRERLCSAGAAAPVAQLRYTFETRAWALHHRGRGGWCSDEDASHAREVGPLLDQIASDRSGRFEGLPPDLWRLLMR